MFSFIIVVTQSIVQIGLLFIMIVVEAYAGRDLRTVTKCEIENSMGRLNYRPRKSPGFRTPYKVFFNTRNRCTSKLKPRILLEIQLAIGIGPERHMGCLIYP